MREYCAVVTGDGYLVRTFFNPLQGGGDSADFTAAVAMIEDAILSIDPPVAIINGELVMPDNVEIDGIIL